jgi:hypothetical protein
MLLLVLNDLLLKMGLDFGAFPGLLLVVMVFCWNARVFYPKDKAGRVLLLTLMQFLVLAAVVAAIVGMNLLLRYLLYPGS